MSRCKHATVWAVAALKAEADRLQPLADLAAGGNPAVNPAVVGRLARVRLALDEAELEVFPYVPSPYTPRLTTAKFRSSAKMANWSHRK